jgi:phosphate starvation-inducible protein PhoH
MKKHAKRGKSSNYNEDNFDAKNIINEHRSKENTPPQIKVRTKFLNKKQKELYNLLIDKESRIILIKGSAGTGKTMITLMAAIHCIANKEYNITDISMCKPIIESAKSIGLLPGTVDEKVALYFTSFYDCLDKLVGKQALTFLKSKGIIKETILNYLRGITLQGKIDADGNSAGAFCILDECQNARISEVKTYISRISPFSKQVLIFDTDQSDLPLPKGEINGADDAWNRLKDIKGVVQFEFSDDDIVREPILIEIMKRYRIK